MGRDACNYLGMRPGAFPPTRARSNACWSARGSAVPFSSRVGQVDYGFRLGPVAIDYDGTPTAMVRTLLKGVRQTASTMTAPVEAVRDGVNEWREEQERPSRQAPDATLLSAQPRASQQALTATARWATEAPGDEPSDSFLYNPLNPVPTAGGGLCCYANAQMGGALDQSMVEHRADVLVYRLSRCRRTSKLIGPVTVTLYASIVRARHRFTAKLVDAGRCGFARNLTDGMYSRARTRIAERAQADGCGQGLRLKIDLWAIADVFKAGRSRAAG